MAEIPISNSEFNSSDNINIIHRDDETIKVEFMNYDRCIVNSIRRSCTSNIESLVFRGFPHDENNIDIKINNTNFTNEYLKDRLTCIPVHINNQSQFSNVIEDFIIELDVTNDSIEKRYVTTGDFKIRTKSIGNYLTKEQVNEIFPANKITKQHILICILYPSNNISETNQQISLEAKLDIASGSENSSWSMVHNSIFEDMPNEAEINVRAEAMKEQGKTDLEIADFRALDARRITIPNHYKMTVESVGVYSSIKILNLACNYIISRIELINTQISKLRTAGKPIVSKYNLKATSINIRNSNNDGENDIDDDDIDGNDDEYSQEGYVTLYKEGDFIVLQLSNDDYTINYMLSIIIDKYFNDTINSSKITLTFPNISFMKEHPSKKASLIYMEYHDPSVEDIDSIIYETLIKATGYIHKIYKRMIDESFHS